MISTCNEYTQLFWEYYTVYLSCVLSGFYFSFVNPDLNGVSQGDFSFTIKDKIT